MQSTVYVRVADMAQQWRGMRGTLKINHCCAQLFPCARQRTAIRAAETPAAPQNCPPCAAAMECCLNAKSSAPAGKKRPRPPTNYELFFRSAILTAGMDFCVFWLLGEVCGMFALRHRLLTEQETKAWKCFCFVARYGASPLKVSAPFSALNLMERG